MYFFPNNTGFLAFFLKFHNNPVECFLISFEGISDTEEIPERGEIWDLKVKRKKTENKKH